jgi:hypothetical protein
VSIPQLRKPIGNAPQRALQITRLALRPIAPIALTITAHHPLDQSLLQGSQNNLYHLPVNLTRGVFQSTDYTVDR